MLDLYFRAHLILIIQFNFFIVSIKIWIVTKSPPCSPRLSWIQMMKMRIQTSQVQPNPRITVEGMLRNLAKCQVACSYELLTSRYSNRMFNKARSRHQSLPGIRMTKLLTLDLHQKNLKADLV